MITVANKVKADQSGQAIIELIIFLPLMFTLYAMISGFADAINGAINQQKFTRAYFNYRTQNNSMVPKPSTSQPGWNKFGIYALGWADELLSDLYPIMPCYQLSIPLNGRSSDTCEASYSEETTQFIRVGTVYGVCGGTFGASGVRGTFYLMPDALGVDFSQVTDVGSCQIR